MKIKKKFKEFIKYRQLFILSLPGVLFLFVFNYIPLYGLVLPFKDYKYDLGFWKSPWVGFNNFKFLFNNGAAWKITKNTLLINFCFIVALLVLGIGVALLINEVTKKYVKFYQTVIFFPYFLSWVVVSFILLSFLDMDKGYLNTILMKFGVSSKMWYNEPKYWPLILVISNTWKNLGYSAIIYYAGLIGINQEYYEAAELDGASGWQKIWNISIPLIRPIIVIMFLLSIGKIFYGNFDLFYNLTRDSSALYPTTDVIDTFVFRALRGSGDIGMASAAGTYQAVVGFVIVIIANFVVKKLSAEDSLF